MHLRDFTLYVAEFYHPRYRAVYPLYKHNDPTQPLTTDDILIAAKIHKTTTPIPFCGDSVDREAVRAILENQMDYSEIKR